MLLRKRLFDYRAGWGWVPKWCHLNIFLDGCANGQQFYLGTAFTASRISL